MKTYCIKIETDIFCPKQFLLRVYDNKNCLIKEEKINNFCEYELNLTCDNYKLVIINLDNFYPQVYLRTLSSSSNCYQKFNFYLQNNNMSKIKAFYLYDKYYLNLPITKGEIKLWQNHITLQ